MKYDFEILVNRESIGNMKYIVSSQIIKEKGLISYAGAEMDFKTAPIIIEALKKRCDNGLFGFTLADEQYIQSIIWWMETQRNWKVDKESIVPTYGTIHSVATAIRAFTEPGDSIIVETPGYSRYEQAATRTGRKTVYCPLIYKDNYYTIDYEYLEKCMAEPRSKLMVLCNPHNPTGRVWKYEELKEIASLAKKHNVLVFSDEIFAEIVFDDNVTIPFNTIPEARDNSIVSTAIGKAFNMTGINNANMIIANPQIRNRFIQQRNADHFGSIDPMTHAALCAAYSVEGRNWLKEVIKYLKNNVEYIMDYFAENIPGVNIIEPEGTFMLWIDWNNADLDVKDIDSFLLNKAYLEMDSGINYGEKGLGFTRMNIAVPKNEIIKSMNLLKNAWDDFMVRK